MSRYGRSTGSTLLAVFVVSMLLIGVLPANTNAQKSNPVSETDRSVPDLFEGVTSDVGPDYSEFERPERSSEQIQRYGNDRFVDPDDDSLDIQPPSHETGISEGLKEVPITDDIGVGYHIAEEPVTYASPEMQEPAFRPACSEGDLGDIVLEDMRHVDYYRLAFTQKVNKIEVTLKNNCTSKYIIATLYYEDALDGDIHLIGADVFGMINPGKTKTRTFTWQPEKIGRNYLITEVYGIKWSEPSNMNENELEQYIADYIEAKIEAANGQKDGNQNEINCNDPPSIPSPFELKICTFREGFMVTNGSRPVIHLGPTTITTPTVWENKTIIINGDFIVNAPLTVKHCYIVADDVYFNDQQIKTSDAIIDPKCTFNGQYKVVISISGNLLCYGTFTNQDPHYHYWFYMNGTLKLDKDPEDPLAPPAKVENTYGDTSDFNNPGGIICNTNNIVVEDGASIVNGTSHGIYLAAPGTGAYINDSVIKNVSGAGVFCKNGAMPQIKGNNISDNAVGVYCEDGSDATVRWNNMTLNTDYGIYVNSASPVIENNTIINEQVTLIDGGSNKFALICCSSNKYPDGTTICDGLPASGLQTYFTLKARGYTDDHIRFMLYNTGDSYVSIDGSGNDLYGPDHIQFTEDDPVIDVQDNAVVKERLRLEMKWLAENVTSGDDVLIYLVNHGARAGGEGSEAYFCFDNGADVSETEMAPWLGVIQVNCSRTVLIVDSCFSGNFISSLGDPNRICVSATADCTGWFIPYAQGSTWAGCVFSIPFWKGIKAGYTIKDAFEYARNTWYSGLGTVEAAQHPQINFGYETPPTIGIGLVDSTVNYCSNNTIDYGRWGMYIDGCTIDLRDNTINESGYMESPSGGIYCSYSDGEMTNTTVHDCIHDGIILDNVVDISISKGNITDNRRIGLQSIGDSVFTLANLGIKRNSNAGLYCTENTYASVSRTNISDNGNGIMCYDYTDLIIDDNCTIRNPSTYNIYCMNYVTAIIRWSVIGGYDTGPLATSGISSYGSSLEITGNNITNCIYGIISGVMATIITHNNISCNNYGLNFYWGSDGAAVSYNNISNNNLFGITDNSVSSVLSYNNISSNGYGISVGDETTLSHNEISWNIEYGVSCGNSWYPNIFENNITHNGANGVYSRDATPILTENNITDNAGCGIFAGIGEPSNDHAPTVVNNNISSNGQSGIYIEEINQWSNGNPVVISGNTITWNSGDGIYSYDSNNVIINDSNIIARNGATGIYCYQTLDLQIISNAIYENTYEGIYIDEHSDAVIQSNHITGHADESAINCHLSGATVDHNNFTDNFQGIGLWQSIASITENDIWSNAESGIYSSDSILTVSRNNITGNAYTEEGAGIYLGEISEAVISWNNITHNYVGVYCVESFININNNNITSNTNTGALIDDSWGIDAEGRPEYQMGLDLGYYIWTDETGWHIRWTGDGTSHEFKGEFTTNGYFTDIQPYNFDIFAHDSWTASANKITFWANESSGEDGFDFQILGKGVLFDIEMDYGYYPEFVYIGESAANPLIIPFALYELTEIKHNVISDNGEAGIRTSESITGIIDNNISYNWNAADEEGFGIYSTDSDCTISDNLVLYNGDGIFMYDSIATINQNKISYNNLNGLLLIYSIFSVMENNISNNWVAPGDPDECGAGIFIYMDGGNDGVIEYNDIIDNGAYGTYCNGISCSGQFTDPIIRDNTIQNNTGAGVNCDEAVPTIINNVIGTGYYYVEMEILFGPAVGGESGPFNLMHGNIFNCTLYIDESGVWNQMVEWDDYELNYDTGEVDISHWGPLNSGDILYAYYNYTDGKGNKYGIVGWQSSTQIIDNMISANKEDGIFMDNDWDYSFIPHIESNLIIGNRKGIMLYNGEATIFNNDILGNRGPGISLYEGKGEISLNIIRGNAEPRGPPPWVILTGIKLMSSGNVWVHDNNISENGVNIYLVDTWDVTIERNNITDASAVPEIYPNVSPPRGIYSVYSEEITIFNNTIWGTCIGMEMTDTYTCNISRNKFYSLNPLSAPSPGRGIYLDNSALDIESNIFGNVSVGIYCYQSSPMIRNNSISNGETGMYLNHSAGAAIISNRLTLNDCGIELDSSEGVLIYHNNFLGNVIQAFDNMDDNNWDNGYPSGGNYWSDYTGIDGNGDGIGDEPYIINIDSQDNYPLMEMYTSSIVPHDPIRIDSDDDFDAAHGVTGGDGSLLYPWIIENYFIDGGEYGYCIYIGNTTEHFVIRDCTFYGASEYWYWPYYINSAVTLCGVQNGQVIGNVALDNEGEGIYIYSSSNTIVNNNILFWNNNQGIYVEESNDNMVANNTISNQEYGILIESSGSIVVANNTAALNQYGIFISGSDSIRITNNTVLYNDGGINLDSSTNAMLFDNWMTDNSISIWGELIEYWNTHTIPPSNTANGNPVYYLKDLSYATVPDGAGEVILANCNGITVEHQCIVGDSEGIILGFSDYNILFNNTLNSNHFDALYLYSSNGNKITNNTACYNDCTAIYIEISDGNLLANNTISNNYGSGMSFDSSNGNTVANNTLFYNENFGIMFGSSDDNVVNNNTVSENDGGLLFSESSGNAITNNTVWSNEWEGIYLYSSSGNVLSNNTVLYHGYDGICIGWQSNNNIIANSTISFNDNGIWIYSSTGNTIYHNNIVGNANQAHDMGGNSWDYGDPSGGGFGGNYWSDYTGIDGNGDGIGDEPYDNISGSSGAQDNYPWMDQDGWI